MYRHLRRWNKWRQHNLNKPFYKFLVLIKVAHSPTFNLTLLDDEWSPMVDGFTKGSEEGGKR